MHDMEKFGEFVKVGKKGEIEAGNAGRLLDSAALTHPATYLDTQDFCPHF